MFSLCNKHAISTAKVGKQKEKQSFVGSIPGISNFKKQMKLISLLRTCIFSKKKKRLNRISKEVFLNKALQKRITFIV
jgi:hypothetical protein